MKSVLLFLSFLVLTTTVYAEDLTIIFFKDPATKKVGFKINNTTSKQDKVEFNGDLILIADKSIPDECRMSVTSGGEDVLFFDRNTPCSDLQKGVKFNLANLQAGSHGKELLVSFQSGEEEIDFQLIERNARKIDNPVADEPTCKIHKAGIPYYDALALVYPERYQLTSTSWASIIKVYFPSVDPSAGNTETVGEKLKTLIKDNEFLTGSFNTDPGALDKRCEKSFIAAAHSKLSNMATSSLKSMGNADVTALADGIAKFLVKRTKEELSITFFDRFKAVITDDKYEDLQVLFPKTYSVLQTMGEEVYDYKSYIQNLREAFKQDIKDLNSNIPDLTETKRGKEFFDKNPELKASLLSACYLAKELDLGAHPGDVLADYSLEILTDKVKHGDHIKNVIMTLQLLSNSLRDSSASVQANYWVTARELRDFVNDKRVFKVYFGLLLQQAINSKSPIKLGDQDLVALLKDFAKNFDKYYDNYKAYLIGLTAKTTAIDRIIHSPKAESDSLRIERDAKYFKATIELLEHATEVAKLPGVKSAKLDAIYEESRQFFDVAYSTTNLVINVNRKNYSAAINELVHIYHTVSVKPATLVIAKVPAKDAEKLKKEEKKVDRLLTKAVKKSNASTSDETKNKAKTLLLNEDQLAVATADDKSDILSKLVQYGGFMSAIATAKSSDEIEAVIEAFAMPAGSARVKREARWNVSLNAYVGPFCGTERIRGVEQVSKPFKHWNSYGLSAPVGIAFSKGIGAGVWKKPFSTSLFISIIDVGALTAFRFKNADVVFGRDTTISVAQAPSIKLKDIVAPGAFISIGIPKCPVSVNFGAQIGANLRNVDVQKNKNNIPDFDVSDNPYIRYSLSVCVDIPILNLYTKSRKNDKP